MRPFSLKENIIVSYKTYFRLLGRTFLATGNTQARLTLRRFAVMLLFSVFLFVLQTMHWLAFIMDEVLFSGYKFVAVRQPVFIVGVPRSGTTFLHRLMSEDRDRFTTFTLWELIFAPSITERKIIFGLARLDRLFGAPLKHLINWTERKAFGSLDDIHLISLSDPEEDYFALAPVYACFLMILPFPFPEELGHLAFFDDQTPEPDKKRIMAFYKTCLQRHLYVHGTDKILLSKNVSFGPMIETLNRTFPDSYIIGTVRDPLRAVPSHISSMMEGAAIFDNDVQGDTFRDQMIDVQRYAYTHLAEALPRLPEDRQMTVKMEDLQMSLRATVRGIYDHLGYDVTPEFDRYLQHQDERQKVYKSGHAYDLSAYNLSDDDIVRRFDDVYNRYDYAPSATAVAGDYNQARC
jgi:omega-hydroxy-beta-dihydromenaquinone-9 sulfotransferase